MLGARQYDAGRIQRPVLEAKRKSRVGRKVADNRGGLTDPGRSSARFNGGDPPRNGGEETVHWCVAT